MKQPTKHIYWLLFPVAALVVLDEVLKYWALHRLPPDGSLVDPGILAFALHKNYGIAFNLPIPLPLVTVITLVIACSLAWLAKTHWEKQPFVAFSGLVLFIGALGNLYDRIVYGFTVDYLILFGTSAINISDVVIILGALLLVRATQKETSPVDKTPRT